jgi:hypothetical protein
MLRNRLSWPPCASRWRRVRAVPNRALELIDPMARAIRPKAAEAAIGLQANPVEDDGLLANAHADRPRATGWPCRPDLRGRGRALIPRRGLTLTMEAANHPRRGCLQSGA